LKFQSVYIYLFLSVWLFALPQAINTHIAKSRISKKDISIYIKETGKNGRVLVSLNATKTRTPASVIKVLSTYASVLKFGFNYRLQTKFYVKGKIRRGVLYGDLIIKGFGDPTLQDRDLTKIVSYIRAEGIKKIKGNIIIDRSYFNVGNKNNSNFDENTYSAYNAMPDAMMFNERVSTVCIDPKRKRAYSKNADKSYKIVNNLRHVNKPCRGKYSWPGVKISQNKTMSTVTLLGQISTRCGKRNVCKVLSQPYKSFYYALIDKMKSYNMSVSGRLKLAKKPKKSVELFTYYSSSLEHIISKTAKKSDNLYARHLMLLSGAKMYGAPATLKKGRKAVAKILADNGALGKGRLLIDNGSGLSRIAKLNASLLAKMYDNAYDRYGQRWMNTLSIAGVDGTIKRRFSGTVVRKRAWMKTGTLRNVKNIGGYVKDLSGNLYTVVILVNSPRARYHATKLQNEIIKWVVKGGAKRGIPKSRGDLIKKVVYTKPTPKVVKQTKVVKKEETPKYYLQLGSFKLRPSRAYIKRIEKMALPYHIKKNKVYKVFVGPYRKKETAQKVLKKVQARVSKQAFIKKM